MQFFLLQKHEDTRTPLFCFSGMVQSWIVREGGRSLTVSAKFIVYAHKLSPNSYSTVNYHSEIVYTCTQCKHLHGILQESTWNGGEGINHFTVLCMLSYCPWAWGNDPHFAKSWWVQRGTLIL